MSVGDLVVREERPPYVRFERQVVEDKAASLAAGHYVGKDVDFVMVTPAGSKDEMVSKVDRWFETTERNVRDGRMNPKWLELWKEGYSRWKNGQEMPLNGTAIRGWGLISPAMQETLIRMHCMTIEDLAAINDEGMRRIGMGALDLKNKAKNWLQAMKDHGPIASQMTALEQENKILKSQIETLGAQVQSLRTAQPVQFVQPVEPEITASDLLEDEPITVVNIKSAAQILEETPPRTLAEQYEAKFGKKPHHRLKLESILAALK